MSHSPTNSQSQRCDSDVSALGAGLLITASSTSSSAGKYARLWRRSITVGVFVSLKKTTTCLPSPTSYSSPLITQENDSDSLRHHESSNAENPVPEINGLISFVSKAYNSFSTNSFQDQGASSSTPSYVPVDQGLFRNLSTQSRHFIDIPSENEEEEKTEEQKLQDAVARIVKQRDLNLLKEFGGVEKVASAFGSCLEHGMVGAQVPGRHKWNTHKTTYTKGFFFFLLKASNNLNILLLLVAAALSFVTGTMEQGPKDGWHDGVAILAAVFMLLTFPSVTNVHRARKLLKKLREEKHKVVRSGNEQLIAICNLVEGDVVKLAKGDQVPGDGLVVNSDGLALDDVLNIKIDRDQNPFLFFGSKVMEGHGTMLVTSVGGNTELGKVLSSVSQDPDEKTLLEAQIEKPNAYMENLSLVVSVLIALVAFIRLLFRKHSGDDNGLPDLKGNVSVGEVMNIFERILLKSRGKITILVGALTVAVIAIQHGMPFVITISLSFWNEKVLINQAKPQNLSAFATMGIVSVICFDATGGLVCNRVEVDKFFIGEKDVNNDAAFEINQPVLGALERGIGASVLVPEISVWPKDDWLVSWAKSRRLNVEFVDRNLSILKHGKLDSEKKACWVLVKNNTGDEEKMMHMHWCGAASTILDMCSQYYDMKGESHAIKDDKRKFQELITDMEDSGLSPVAFACGQTEVSQIKEDGLHLLALAGLRYPCPDKSTIEALRDVSVRSILVSEDKLSAVRDIACELGTFRPDSNDVAIEGEQFRDLNLTERMAKVDKMTLMGSCFAEDKLLLVRSLQQKGHVVAFFGGSSNRDTPALKAANIGITEDNRCTEMASESSDIVISSKGSLLPVMKLGRCAYRNIQKFTQLQLTGCISGLLVTLVTTLSLEESPITSIQLIWVYWIMYILGGIMMIMEFKDEEPTNPPARRTESLLHKVMWKHIVAQVLCQVFVLLIFQFKGQVIRGMNKDIQKAMIFNSFTLCQVFNQFNAMRLVKKEVLSVVLRNYTFLMALVIVIVMQVLVVEFATSLAGYKRLNVMQWGVCFVLATLPWGIHSAANFISDSFSSMSFLSNGFG